MLCQYTQFAVIGSYLGFALIFGFSPVVYAEANHPSSVSSAAVERLSKQSDQIIKQNEVLSAIREVGEKRGVGIWAFGGLAATIVDSAAKNQSLVNYSSQDWDVSVEGPQHVVDEVERELVAKFPLLHLDVRPFQRQGLLPGIGDKEFYTVRDSLSIGLVRLTSPPAGQPRITDVVDTSKSDGIFIQSVLGQVVHLIPDLDGDPERAIEAKRTGPISLRMLIKAHQFGYALTPQAEAFILTHMSSDARNGDFFENARELRSLGDLAGKALLQSQDPQSASADLDRLKIRQALMNIRPSEAESPGWWMKQRPLRRFPIGQGEGETAGQLKLNEIAYAVPSGKVYHSLVSSPLATPSAFGERVSTGQPVVEGLLGTKQIEGEIFLHFPLKAEARLGSDFELAEGGKIRVLNGNALEKPPHAKWELAGEAIARAWVSDGSALNDEKWKLSLIPLLRALSREELRAALKYAGPPAALTEEASLLKRRLSQLREAFIAAGSGADVLVSHFALNFKEYRIPSARWVPTLFEEIFKTSTGNPDLVGLVRRLIVDSHDSPGREAALKALRDWGVGKGGGQAPTEQALIESLSGMDATVYPEKVIEVLEALRALGSQESIPPDLLFGILQDKWREKFHAVAASSLAEHGEPTPAGLQRAQALLDSDALLLPAIREKVVAYRDRAKASLRSTGATPSFSKKNSGPEVFKKLCAWIVRFLSP